MEGSNLPARQDLGEPGLITAEPVSPRRRSFVGGWAIAAVLAVLAVLVYEIRIALLPFVFATAVAFVTVPLIRSLQRRLNCPRWPVAAALYLLILMVLVGAGFWVGTTAASDLTRIVAQAPQILQHFLTELVGNQGIILFGKTYTPQRMIESLGVMLGGNAGATAVETAANLAGSALFGIVLTLVLMPYLMISAPRLAAGTIWLLPPARRPSVERLLPKIVPMLRRYIPLYIKDGNLSCPDEIG